GVAGGRRRDRLRPDVLVDQLGGLPELVDVGAGVEAEARERLRDRLTRDPVQAQRDWIDGARDQIGAGTHRLQAGSERVPARALAVEADRQAALGAEQGDELLGAVRLERAGRVVQQAPRGATLRKLLRL